MREPPVKLCIRTSVRDCTWRFENEWPLARTQYTRFYLTTERSRCGEGRDPRREDAGHAARDSGTLAYDAGPASDARAERGLPTVSFSTEPLAADTEITGPINLVMWVSSETDDMDLFAYLRKTMPDGTVQTATRGVLKVSHRKLDPALSTPERPYHSHDVGAEAEARRSREGRSGDLADEHGVRERHAASASTCSRTTASTTSPRITWGRTRIHIGGEHASYVLLPIVPPRSDARNRAARPRMERSSTRRSSRHDP